MIHEIIDISKNKRRKEMSVGWLLVLAAKVATGELMLCMELWIDTRSECGREKKTLNVV
jgi:hypothetical protein